MTLTQERPAQTAAPSPLVTLPDSAQMPRKLWTLEECGQLMALGLLEENSRYELLEGEIVDKMSFNEPHVYVSFQVYKALMAIFGVDYLRLAAPIALSPYGGPEPDAAVMLRPMGEYLSLGTPPPTDVRLAVEVADATLATDRAVKGFRYGQAGIPEYWIVNIPQRQVEVYRQPTPEGYVEQFTVAEDGMIAALASPTVNIAVADLLP